MGLSRTLEHLRDSVSAAFGRIVDKVFSDEPDSSAVERFPFDPTWSGDAGGAGLPSQLRGGEKRND